MRDGFAVPAQGVLGFGGREFGHFAFVDLFGFFDSEPWLQVEGPFNLIRFILRDEEGKGE